MAKSKSEYTLDKRNYLQIADWVEQVIKSCSTLQQVESSERLVKLYRQQTNNRAYSHVHSYLIACLTKKKKNLK